MADRDEDAANSQMVATAQESARDIVIVGAGTYGAVIAELAVQCGYVVRMFLDDNEASWTSQGTFPISGPVDSELRKLPAGSSIAVALGNNEVRTQLLNRAQTLRLKTPSLVSPTATVSPSATIEEAVFLHHGCHVWTQAHIGFGSILSVGATVAHHTVLGEGCFVSTAANVGASIVVGAHAMFGMNSTTSTGVRSIGARGIVGAGAVIVRDTEPGGIYVGSPGKLIRHVDAR